VAKFLLGFVGGQQILDEKLNDEGAEFSADLAFEKSLEATAAAHGCSVLGNVMVHRSAGRLQPLGIWHW
jgi:hypothetical protein